MKAILITIICLVTINCGHTLIITDYKRKTEYKCIENLDSARLIIGVPTFGYGYLLSPDMVVMNIWMDDNKKNSNYLECSKIESNIDAQKKEIKSDFWYIPLNN